MVSFYSPEAAIRSGHQHGIPGTLTGGQPVRLRRTSSPIASRSAASTMSAGDQLYRRTEDFLSRFELATRPTPARQASLDGLSSRFSGNPQGDLNRPQGADPRRTHILADRERDRHFSSTASAKLQAEGLSVIYITHKLFEVFKLASRVVVLRDGKLIGSKLVDEVNEERSGGHDGRAPDIRTCMPIRRAGAPRESCFQVRGLAARASSPTSASSCTGARSSAWPA